MRFFHRRAAFALAAAFALGLSTTSKDAAAQWISLSSSTPAEPGYLTNSERFYFWFLTTGAIAPMVYAGAIAAYGDEAPADTKRDVGFTLGGVAVGAMLSAFVPSCGPGEPLGTLTVIDGIFWGMAGVGIGGAASSSPRAMLLGGSVGYEAVALYRMFLSFGGYADYRSGAVGQVVLGIIATSGCFLGSIGADPQEAYLAYTCGGISALTTLQGMVAAAKRDRPWPKPEEKKEGGATTAFAPAPWFDPHGGGLSLRGVF